MTDIDLRIQTFAEAETSRLEMLRALNTEFQAETSLLNPTQWQTLTATSSYAVYVAPAAALLIAFTSTADYDNPNFQWFVERFDSFIYVDRIIVSAQAQGQGLGKHLYTDLFGWARRAGLSRVCCEVNQQPPNPGSDAFHERMGFLPAGQARLEHNGKVVSYLTKLL